MQILYCKYTPTLNRQDSGTNFYCNRNLTKIYEPKFKIKSYKVTCIKAPCPERKIKEIIPDDIIKNIDKYCKKIEIIDNPLFSKSKHNLIY